METLEHIRFLIEEKTSLLEQKTILEKERVQIARIILKYEIIHNSKVDSLVLEILKLKTKLALRKAENEPNNAVAQQAYVDAMSEEGGFDDPLDQLSEEPTIILATQQENEIKTKFGKIVFSVHPDYVHPYFHKEAVELFIKATKAKQSNDLETIRLLYEYLKVENHFPLKDEELSEHDIIKIEIKHLRYLIEQIAENILSIKNNEPYLTISQIKNWDTYFDDIRYKLKTELTNLEMLINEQ